MTLSSGTRNKVLEKNKSITANRLTKRVWINIGTAQESAD